jgi:hypothetical protein
VTAYSREVSELGEFGEGANDNEPAEPDTEGTEIGDAVPPPAPEGEPAPAPAPTPQSGS